jgi:hypothetical protein
VVADYDIEPVDFPPGLAALYPSPVANYRGPATLTLTGGARYTGTAILRTVNRGGRTSWGGSFVPADGSPVNTGGGTVELDGHTADVLVQNWGFDGGKRTAVLLGQGEPPY